MSQFSLVIKIWLQTTLIDSFFIKIKMAYKFHAYIDRFIEWNVYFTDIGI